jgi:hypothetical protein
VNMCRTVNDAPEWLASIVQAVLVPVSVPAFVKVSVPLIPRLLNCG